MKNLLVRITKFENMPFISAIKSGLIMLIPILMLGSTTLVFEYFPIAQYQHAVQIALSGKLFHFFDLIYDATFGMLSVYLTCTISFCYARQYTPNKASLVFPLTSLICFFIFSGFRVNDFPLGALGVKGVFIAILSALLSTDLLRKASRLAANRMRGYAEDSDVEFNNSVAIIIPVAAVIAFLTLLNIVVTSLLAVDSIYSLFVKVANAIFAPYGRGFVAGFLFVLISSILWYFGIHGSDVLEPVMENLFTPAIDTNMALAAAGRAPTEIFTKQFFDIFVLMGGCGTAICLLISLLIFSKRRRNRHIVRLAAIPVLFNINELMIFGYPVIYNTTLFLPFIITPLFSFCTAYLAMRLGILPMVTAQVNWTAPVLLSGYMATGSIIGSLVQLFNIIIGILIYRPFVKAYDRHCESAAQSLVSGLTDIKKDSESTLTPVVLTALTDEHGSLARSIAADLKYAIEQKILKLYYQPQYNINGECIGIESLLRWKHPLYGMIYPPLIIQLARETDMLLELEEYVLLSAISDSRIIRSETGYDKEMSVNISSATLQTKDYMSLLQTLAADGTVKNGEICLEVTEQTAMLSNEKTLNNLQSVKDLGYLLAIDDFSMGHTSLTYLQASCFNIVKLDGALVKDMMINPRSYDIIKTITSLAKKLSFSVIAEYVETQDQVKMLHDADCFWYQGWLFSPALDLDSLINRLKSDKQNKLKESA